MEKMIQKNTGNPEACSLDDIAAQFVQLERSDAAGVTRMRNALKDMASQGALPEGARSSVERAASLLESAMDHDGTQSEQLMSQVGRLIEEAQNELWSSGQEQNSSGERLKSESEGFEVLPANTDMVLLKEYVAENCELIEGAERALLTLETTPEDDEAINTVFRAFHTIKGTSAFLALEKISEFAHLAEDLFGRIRDKEIPCTGGYADLALRSTDMLKELMGSVEDAMSGDPLIKPEGFDQLTKMLENPEAAGIAVDSNPVGTTDVPEKNIQLQKYDERPEKIGTNERLFGKNTAETSMRVRTDRLDCLIDMVGELVIAQAMVSQEAAVNRKQSGNVARTSKIVRELQDLSMALRMVPLKATFNKMARLARDLARAKEKRVHFVGEGDATEIDRNMVEILNDPLIHMVRNALDHGIEPPDERLRNGKSAEGTLHLFAYHSGSSVVVEIRDDGRGLNKEKILQRAIDRKLVDAHAHLTDIEIYELIFKPGFSTSDAITDVSGRGVGLDVVKKGVEALQGRIDIFSEEGTGSTFTLKMPLTLAITDGMLIKVGDQRFIIPALNIHTTLRPSKDTVTTVADRGEMVILRDEVLPLFRLYQIFNIEGGVEDPTQGLLIVISDGELRCALLVDELLGQQQVVAKRLRNGVGDVRGISGAAILGDGRVGLILDASEIAESARALNNGNDASTIKPAYTLSERA